MFKTLFKVLLKVLIVLGAAAGIYALLRYVDDSRPNYFEIYNEDEDMCE